ncbi:hypothetical protein UO65_2911 [Actinokineospora spheciospongiae]|uniref:Uncharacterized protein n=1 Tax=Actinokineospora spheciospongiae TaxID=909613 RepID=W7IYB7_9PSEU|nr:hypothetical protein [Actinokineospora spheciospongiae]EWC61852.1 hypothetical protein UO65_2911 [Actinokineospora spheciospongiae]PWW63305.1 hypothetical protein DFQ13_104295 [Actinokineospora spheciospongiae]
MTTKFDPEAIRTSAKKLGALMDDMGAFSKLKPHWPNAGQFELAQWLERVVDDRRNGIVAHAEHLKIALEQMETTLTHIADDFENLDGDNAKKIKDSIGELKKNITSGITTLDQNTEKDQGNFGGRKNDADGDGYNDSVG